ncbi:MAG TPA: hypothetical protein VKB86_13960 [Pyrinomonadaceae bacterium]|nr:hypothetical protein [Pyrinomonadaceae bacterium]
MTNYKRLFKHSLAAFILAATALFVAPQTACASDPEFDAITNHLKLHYNARRVHIPFLGLANFFVHVVHPAGVKSFKVAVFENLNFTADKPDSGLSQVMRSALSTDWQPMVRASSREGEQVYVYARSDGANIKMMVVTVDRDEAVVARFKFSPEKLSEFLNNPKILGISLRG